jgi:glyoxylase-like metal-dependent hydrolase (beta-lactamase superfamily II)
VNRRKLFVIGCALLGLAIVLGVVGRRMLVIRTFALLQSPPPLSEITDEGEGVRWFDEYYTVQRIDRDTIAIGEPRHWQKNYSYLIVGRSRAVLFDSGPGVRDIHPLVTSLTSAPVTVVASHLHFDHVGNHERFESLAMVDLPELRAMAEDDVLQLTEAQHVGFLEGFDPPTLRITEWWEPGSTIDLGGRRVEVIHSPGHTPESIVLLDRDRRQAFTGDHIYPGDLIAFLPGADIGDYLATTERLMERLPRDTFLLTAHRADSPGAPLLRYEDLADLRDGLKRIKAGDASGSGLFPRSYPINDRLSILTDLAWLQSWN